YHYSTYEEDDEVKPAVRPRVVILGAGPNRIGQGIEFDYACVHASFALEEAGYESVMVNSNPETVSTDYDTSSRLYFEPLAAEDVLAVCAAERPLGVIAQFGGQTPLMLARILREEGGASRGRVGRVPRRVPSLLRPGRSLDGDRVRRGRARRVRPVCRRRVPGAPRVDRPVPRGRDRGGRRRGLRRRRRVHRRGDGTHR